MRNENVMTVMIWRISIAYFRMGNKDNRFIMIKSESTRSYFVVVVFFFSSETPKCLSCERTTYQLYQKAFDECFDKLRALFESRFFFLHIV